MAVAASLVFLVAVAPWVWRCSQTYGRFVAFRGGIGLEILVGSSDDTSTVLNIGLLPAENPAEMEKLKRLGEPQYMAEKQREAGELIARRPLRYAGLCLRRVLHSWTSIWDFPPRLTVEEPGLPNVLMYSLVSLLALVGLSRAIRERRDGVIRSRDPADLPSRRLLPDPFRGSLSPSD